MSKSKAALIHVIISVIVISIFAMIVYLIWYPKPFVEISRVIEPLKLLIVVDVIIGPLLTFVVYKKNKKYLKIDLSLIALMQLTALGYGVHTIYNGKPSIVVIHNGEFHYLMEKYSNFELLKNNKLKPSIFSKPKMAYIESTEFIDLYNAFPDMQPIESFETTLLPFSLTTENMKARFKNKANEIDGLVANYDNNDTAFFQLDKDSSKFYVLYSKSQNTIVDYIKF